MAGGRVLVVDDDQGCRDLYSEWLADDFAVQTVETGRAGLDRIGWPDVVVLDRQLPDVEGTTVAESIDENQADPYVVMVTGVDPGVEILNVPVDAYLTKPVDVDRLSETVERMVARGDCEETLREFFSLHARKAVLERGMSPSKLAGLDEYHELIETLERRRATVRQQLDTFDDERRKEISEALGEGTSGAESSS